MDKKPTYRIRNWKQYNKALIQRGSITLWFSDNVIQKWTSTVRTGAKGRPHFYSNDAILCALLIRTAYHLPLRTLAGFLLSLVAFLKLNLSIPSYTQICRRAKSLGKSLEKLSRKRPKDIVFDSTGLKVYGEGEWKMRLYGASKRRTWKKFHIGVDPDSGEIILAELTDNGVGSGDGETAKKLLPKLPKGIERVFGDGAYDGIEFRREIEKIGAKPCIPPPRGAVLHKEVDSAFVGRNNAIREIIGLGGDDEARKLWKILCGYHRRSLGETVMYRLKQLTGGVLRSREQKRQHAEAMVKCMVINTMTKLGMPKGKWVYE